MYLQYQVAAIILTSAGKSFCAGIDISAIRDNPDFEEHITREVDPFYAVQECQVPVIYCVNGPAIIGGFELAVSADIVVACRDAVLETTMPCVRFSFSPFPPDTFLSNASKSPNFHAIRV